MNIYDQIVEWLKNHWISAVILLILLGLTLLPKVRDGFVLLYTWVKKLFGIKRRDGTEEPIVLHVSGETVTFTEHLRSVEFDVVKIDAHTHGLGVASEYEWVKRRYPGSEVIKQELTTLEMMSGKSEYDENGIHFDVLSVVLADGHKKEVYFDISSFFSGLTSSIIDPKGYVAKKISEFYK